MLQKKKRVTDKKVRPRPAPASLRLTISARFTFVLRERAATDDCEQFRKAREFFPPK